MILDTHNKFRARIANGQENGQPKAANMNKLQWNDEIAKFAQRWADQCPSYPNGHDKNRKSPSLPNHGLNGGFVGQNVAWGIDMAPTFDYQLADRVQQWYDEVNDWDTSEIGNFTQKDFGKIGHYSQLVWAKTQYVGCGATYYKDADYYKKILVCNYYPSGNVPGQPVYQIGAPGTKCASGKSQNGLCLV